MALLLAAMLAFGGRVAGQEPTGTVLVRVRHAAAPLAGAQVRSGGKGASTDSRGEARLMLPAGERRIAISRLGFADTTVTATVRAGAETALAVEPREVALEAEAIVVTAARSGTVVSDQPIRVEAVPPEEIQENQTLAPGNVSTLLMEIPGVRVESSVPGLGGAGLRLRGMPGRLSRVLLDGLPLLGAQVEGFGLLQTPPLDLARVEVIKGVASALYGGSAVGGVLNLVSQRPTGDPILLLNRTSLGGSDLVGFLPGRLSPRWAYTLTGGAHAQARTDVDGDGWAELPGYRRATLRPRLFWDDGRGGSLLATLGVSGENRSGGTLAAVPLPGGAPYRERLDTRHLDAGMAGHLLRRGLVLGGRGSLTLERHQRGYGARDEADREATLFTEGTVAGAAAGHTWLLGGALEYESLRAAGIPGVGFTYLTPGVFVQDEVSPTRWLSATLSARADVHDRLGAFFSPRLSLLLRPGGGTTLRASAGTGWAPPRPLLDEVEAVGLSRLAPLVGLRAERAASASLDAAWHGGPWELSASAFGSRLRNPLSQRQTAAPARLELYSADRPWTTRGAEALVHFTAGPMHAIGSYTYLAATEPGPAGGRQWAERVPRHTGEAGFILEDETLGRAGLEVAYTGRMRLENDPYRSFSPPYYEVNALAARNFGETQLFLNAENLLDVRQSRVDPLLRPTPSPLGAPATDVWGILAGRVFNLGIRLEL